MSNRDFTEERRRRYRLGLAAETVAAAWLMLRGWRILARRHKTPAGEIDIVAVRGRRLAFIEVKRRRTAEDAEASIGPKQRQRIRRAADLWLARHQHYLDREIGFDVVFLLPRRWPRHIENGL